VVTHSAIGAYNDYTGVHWSSDSKFDDSRLQTSLDFAVPLSLRIDVYGIGCQCVSWRCGKGGRQLSRISNSRPFSDFYPLINTHIALHWQRLWNAETNNKLHSFRTNSEHFKSYIEKTSWSFTDFDAPHSCIFAEQGEPAWVQVTPLAVKHILLDCTEFKLIRVKYYTCSNLSELFSNVPSRAIIDFIEEIKLYRIMWI
jgi:hypothetical protein